ncbi:hypothetical protein [uncultured Chitinophaga sp.]|jgi:VanZ like family.|uniref:hypothetical protein n=1 Tax=uncultured Chitinophaga sp. TaxID=339340 RepID=UPI002614D260|nr:hypothetical protein [uncultured Chitinophaga sp.]
MRIFTHMLNNIAPDKWRHFWVGILMGALLQSVAWLLLPQHPLGGTLIVLAIVVMISYGFELFSLISGHGHYDIMDAVASIIGGVLGMALNWGALWVLL